MAGNVIAKLNQVTIEWLTAVLSTSDALTYGTVAAFDTDAGQGNWSSNAVLRLRYEEGARGKLPRRVFLKMVDTGASSSDESFGESEVIYYTRDYIDVEDVPLIRCYDAAYSSEQHRYHLLLDDLSETHIEAAEKTPTLEYGLALAEGLAAMHARWWGTHGLAKARAPVHSEKHIRRFAALAVPGAGHIIENFSAQLEPHWPDMMRALYANHPEAMVERTKDANGFTLIHGDVGHNNVLVPHTGDRPLYIIDRQPFDWSLTTWLGVYDLAYAMVLDWEIETRRQLEMQILRRYHDQLIKKGVEDYSWQRLQNDYGLCAAMGVYIATEYCRDGVNERRIPVWLPMLQRSLTACDDLDCGGLW